MGGKSDQLVTDLEYVDLLDRITDTTPIITTGKIEGSLCYQVCIDEMASVDLAMEHLFSLGPSAYCTDRREKYTSGQHMINECGIVCCFVKMESHTENAM